ncbi:MAG: M1 family metallopeptidase [Balneolales bacterium]|nr:M1 family metallopeptidase [Balneolales bacterium]
MGRFTLITLYAVIMGGCAPSSGAMHTANTSENAEIRSESVAGSDDSRMDSNGTGEVTAGTHSAGQREPGTTQTGAEATAATASSDTSGAASRVRRIEIPEFIPHHQRPLNDQILDSGMPLIPEMAAYNVRYYDLDVALHPSDQSVTGVVTAVVDIVHPLDWYVVDLDTTLTIHKAVFPDDSWRQRTAENRTSFTITAPEYSWQLRTERRGNRVWMQLPRTWQPGEELVVQMHYSGKPRIAPNPPWDGGFSWRETPDGYPWIGVSCQTNGADLWWPVKDHNSDRADSVAIHITVPDPLFAASNGRYQGKSSNANGTATYHWFSSSPISNYNVTVNAGPYTELRETYISTSGDSLAIYFWVLPEDTLRARELMPQFSEQLNFFERFLGPYPFRNEKYGVVQTSYLGMEHQTLIAYGAGFRNDVLFRMGAGYDDLHHHELAHEWWGNLVTVHDWKDFWIHEGFATYMQALYTEELHGARLYQSQMRLFRGFLQNTAPMAPRSPQSSRDMYAGRDIYYKGAFFLHTLRYLIGDEDFFMLLRRFAYPDPALERYADGRALRFTSTDEFKLMTERLTGRSLDWLFDVYLHQPELPELLYYVDDDHLLVEWKTPVDVDFTMPVPVRIGESIHHVEINEGLGRIRLYNQPFEIDPDGWLLRVL